MARNQIADLRVFVQVVESGSFSAAARATGVSQPNVSKAVAALERNLGARLVNRTTRNVTPTETGLAYFQRCKSLLTALDHADDEARLGHSSLQGWLRVNTSNMLGGRLVLPAVAAFSDAYPEVQIDIALNDNRVDPVQEGVDIIVRSGALDDSTLVVRRAGSAALIVVAAPAYLDALGHSVTKTDLSGSFIGWSLRGSGPIRDSIDDPSGTAAEADLTTQLRLGNALLMREALLQGLGVAALPAFLVASDIDEGRLVRLLPDTQMSGIEVSILHPFGNAPPRKIKAFCDFAVAYWRRNGLLSVDG